MDLQLKGKIALVTGGSRNIGLATALQFAREGCDVAICSRHQAELDKAAATLRKVGARVFATVADITCDSRRLIAEVVAAFGGIDILINNAATAKGGGLLASTDADWRETFEANFFAAARLIRLAVPAMRQRPDAAIVNVASISGWRPQLAGNGQYGGSKAATIFLAEVLALELVQHGIRVNVVSPGSIWAPGNSWDEYREKNPQAYADYVHNGFPMGRLGTNEEVADVIVFVASPRARWINGRHIPVDGLEQPVPVAGFRLWEPKA